MALPIKFRQSPDVQINADIQDFVSGIEYQRFFLFNSQEFDDSSGLQRGKFGLISFPVMSQRTTSTSGAASSTSFIKCIAENFDTAPFLKSRTMDGTIYFNISSYIRTNQSAGSLTTYVHFGLYTVKANSETLVASGATVQYSEAATSSDTRTSSITTSLANIKIDSGDRLRVKVEQYCKDQSTPGTMNLGFAHSPLNLSASGGGVIEMTPSDSSIYIPFKPTF